MNKIIIIAIAFYVSALQADAQCSTTPNNFEIRLQQSKAHQINIAIRYHQDANIICPSPDTNNLLDGFVFAFSWPSTSTNIAIQSCKSTHSVFELIIDKEAQKQALQKTQSDFIQTIFHNNTMNMPISFNTNWQADTWIELATITYSGALQQGDYFSLLNCDYGQANPNSNNGNSTTDPWFAMFNAENKYVQYSPKMITEKPIQSYESIYISPIPTTGLLHINVQSYINTNAIVKVINMQGQLLKTILFELQKGENKNEIDISDLPVGSYQIQLNDGKTISFNKTVLKQ
jgi:Secretion system C-terminal sorting domain